MKKLILAAIFLSTFSSKAFCHSIVSNAANITRGILPNERLDPSSVTLLGPQLGIDFANRTQVWNDEGQPLGGGQVNSVNCVGAGISCTQNNSTVTLTILTNIRREKIVVGTTPIYGADIVSTTTFGFNMAIASVANGGNIFIQKGDYYCTNITTLVRVTMTFEDSATVKFMDGQRLDTAFIVSTGGILNDVNIDIATSIYRAVHNPLIRFVGNGKVIRPRLNIQTCINVSGAKYGGDTVDSGLFFWDADAQSSLLQDLHVTSMSFIAMNGGASMDQIAENFNWFHVKGGTDNWVINPRIYEYPSGTANPGAWRIGIDGNAAPNGVDGFHIIGGMMQAQSMVLSTERADSGMFIRNFDWKGTKIVALRNLSSGVIGLLSSAGVIVSSGCSITGLSIDYRVAQSAAGILVTGAMNSGWTFRDLDVYATVGAAGGGFSIGAGVVGTFITGARISGTTACMADSGVSTFYTDASGGGKNLCNGNAP